MFQWQTDIYVSFTSNGMAVPVQDLALKSVNSTKTFKKGMKPILLQKLGIMLFLYLDDIVILADS